MKQQRFLFRLIPSGGEKEGFLATVKAIAQELGVSVKHPRWTSYGAIELDAFAPSTQDFETFIAALEPLSRLEFTRSLDAPPSFRPKGEVMAEAIRYFNSERFWECHEALESIWRPAQGGEKKLVQGIILVCAALVHEQRGERAVALQMYRRALPQIVWQERRYYGMDIPRFRRRVEDSLARGEALPFKV